jgi:hypothetical protein
METRKILLVLTLVIVLVLSATVWFYPPTGDFRTDNPFWNGISVLSDQAKVTPLDALSNLPTSGKGTALIVVPYEQFSETELSQLKSYVSSGGTLLLLDDYGFGNQVLSGLGLEMQFIGQPLLDPLFDYHNEQLPKISDFETIPVLANVSSVVFNHATALSGTAGVSVIANSSSFSFVDINEDGGYDAGDLSGPLPVAAYVNVGQGCVVAVADPSCLINGMVSMDDNLLFISNVVSIKGDTSQVFVDQSHLPSSSLDEAKGFLAIIYGVVASPLGTLSLIALALAISLKSFLRKRENYEDKR